MPWPGWVKSPSGIRSPSENQNSLDSASGRCSTVAAVGSTASSSQSRGRVSTCTMSAIVPAAPSNREPSRLRRTICSGRSSPGSTILDRFDQVMILFAADCGEALKRILVEEEIGKDARF